MREQVIAKLNHHSSGARWDFVMIGVFHQDLDPKASVNLTIRREESLIVEIEIDFCELTGGIRQTHGKQSCPPQEGFAIISQHLNSPSYLLQVSWS
jgi:hypothetical protein